METRAGDPGAFAHFDLSRVDSPAFVVDVQALRRNLAVLADIRDRAGIKVLAALKAFSMWQVAPIVGNISTGCAPRACGKPSWRTSITRARSPPIARPTRRKTCPRSARCPIM
jgi:hypothetical protein